MRNRVKVKANYIVNPEKKVVVCVLECDMQLKVYREIEKYFLNCAALVNESVEACEQTVKVEEAHVELMIGE